MSQALYRQRLLQRYRSCPYKRVLNAADFQFRSNNPSCGDSVCLSLTISDDMINEIVFQGAGCVISQVAASLLCEHVQGRVISYATSVSAEDIRALLAIPLGPTRVRCATLSLEALRKIIAQYQTGSVKNAQSNSSN